MPALSPLVAASARVLSTIPTARANSLQGPAVLLEDVFNPLEQWPLPFPRLNLGVDPFQLSFIFCNPSFRGRPLTGRGVFILDEALVFSDFGFKIFHFPFQLVQGFECFLFCLHFSQLLFEPPLVEPKFVDFCLYLVGLFCPPSVAVTAVVV